MKVSVAQKCRIPSAIIRTANNIRNIGLAAAIDLEPIEGQAGRRGMQVFENGFRLGAALRVTGDTVAVAPPFIIEESEVSRLIDIIRQSIAEASY